MARLPDLVAASARLARSNDSARHAFVIGPAAPAGITPSAASARASAASKSSMFCRVVASSQTARIAALDSIGASRGERDVLICARPNHYGLSLPMPLDGPVLLHLRICIARRRGWPSFWSGRALLGEDQ